MSERGIHRIDDDLSDGWIDSWIAGVVDEIETFLGKHAAFHAFLDDRD